VRKANSCFCGRCLWACQGNKFHAQYKGEGPYDDGPYAENPESVRYVFSKLRDLSIDIGKEKFDNSNMEILSMGMSNDFEIAIEEGANMVRIGTGSFWKQKLKFNCESFIEADIHN